MSNIYWATHTEVVFLRMALDRHVCYCNMPAGVADVLNSVLWMNSLISSGRFCSRGGDDIRPSGCVTSWCLHTQISWCLHQYKRRTCQWCHSGMTGLWRCWRGIKGQRQHAYLTYMAECETLIICMSHDVKPTHQFSFLSVDAFFVWYFM